MLTTASLGSTRPPPALDGATMVGRNESITLVSAGVVPRYGSGDDARSTPDGEQLIAFRVSAADGDLGRPPASGGLTVSVTGSHARKVPQAPAGGYAVLAVPASATATLVLDDGGLTQSLSLPGGVAGAGNIAVFARRHRFVNIGKTVSVPVHLSNGTDAADVTYRTTITSAALDFWIPRHPASHPSNPGSAFLSVDLAYTDPSAPGDTFGWDPQLLRLRLPDGTSIPARNIATAGDIFDVFQVPAGFTRGTLQFTGTETVRGITLKLTRPIAVAISIPPG